MRIAQEDVVGGLHQPLAGDDVLAGLAYSLGPRYGSSSEALACFTCKKSGSPSSSAFPIGDEAAADAPHAHHLVRHIHQPVAGEQTLAALLQRCEVSHHQARSARCGCPLRACPAGRAAAGSWMMRRSPSTTSVSFSAKARAIPGLHALPAGPAPSCVHVCPPCRAKRRRSCGCTRCSDSWPSQIRPIWVR